MLFDEQTKSWVDFIGFYSIHRHYKAYKYILKLLSLFWF